MPAREGTPEAYLGPAGGLSQGARDLGKMRPKSDQVIRLAFFHHLMLYWHFEIYSLAQEAFKCMHP